MPRNGVDQRAVKVAHSRMYHQSCRFVDDHQLVVLINHVEGNILGFDGCIVVWPVEHQRDDIARAHLIVAFHRLAVDMYESGVGSFLNTVARRVLNVFRHVFVDAYRFLSAIDLHAQMLIEFTVRFPVNQCDVVQLVYHARPFYSSTGGSFTSSNSSVSPNSESYNGVGVASTYS